MDIVLRESLVFSNVEAANREEVLRFLAEQLQTQSMVSNGFSDAILAREAEYPTGLNTSALGLAIPHADACHVLQNAFAVAKLRTPVLFRHMAEDTDVAVELVFMMALNNASEQIQILSGVLALFTDDEIGKRLHESQNASEIYQIIHTRMKQICGEEV